MRTCIFLAALLSFGLLGLAAPTTQPTSQPVKPKPDERQVIDKTHGFSFNVPRHWTPVPQKGDRSLYIFHIPAPGAHAKAASSWILLVEPNASTDFEKVVDHMRQTILERNKDPKIESDRESTLLGQPAWEFIYTMKMTMKVVNKSGNKTLEETEEFPARVRSTIFLHNGALYQFVLTADQPGFATRAAAADKVVKTFVLGSVPADKE